MNKRNFLKSIFGLSILPKVDILDKLSNFTIKKKRALTCKWTVEMDQELQSMYGIKVEYPPYDINQTSNPNCISL